MCDCSNASLETGLRVTEECLRELEQPDLPAVLISTECDPGCRSQAQRAGVALLPAPLRPARLRALLTRLTGNTAEDEEGNPA